MNENTRGILLFCLLLGLLVSGDVFAAVISSKPPLNTSKFCTAANGLCPHDNFALGTWYNMPAATTELFGNTDYEVPLLPVPTSTVLGQIVVTFVINCLVASNSFGAYLQLQVQNVTGVVPPAPQAQLVANGPWTNIGPQMFIDNTVPCGSNGFGGLTNLETTGQTLANQKYPLNGWLFRVLGSGGGGAGDNPQFAYIGVELFQLMTFLPIISIIVSVFADFQYQLTQPVKAQGPETNIIFYYIATNETGQQVPPCGNVAGAIMHCFESGIVNPACTIPQGLNSCNGTIPYNIAFTKNPVNVVATLRTNNANTYLTLGPLVIFSTEVVTV